jgi:hypothetical protein
MNVSCFPPDSLLYAHNPADAGRSVGSPNFSEIDAIIVPKVGKTANFATKGLQR